MAGPNWGDLDRKREQEEAPATPRFDELCAALFSTGAGAELMNLMRARTIERRSGRGAHDAILREDEAIRRFVASLEAARDRGNKPAPKSG